MVRMLGVTVMMAVSALSTSIRSSEVVCSTSGAEASTHERNSLAVAGIVADDWGVAELRRARRPPDRLPPG